MSTKNGGRVVRVGGAPFSSSRSTHHRKPRTSTITCRRAIVSLREGAFVARSIWRSDPSLPYATAQRSGPNSDPFRDRSEERRLVCVPEATRREERRSEGDRGGQLSLPTPGRKATTLGRASDGIGRRSALRAVRRACRERGTTFAQLGHMHEGSVRRRPYRNEPSTLAEHRPSTEMRSPPGGSVS